MLKTPGSTDDHDLELDEVDTDNDSETVEDDAPVLETAGSDDDDVGSDPRPIVRRARAKTIAMKRLTKEELRIGALLYPSYRVHVRGCYLDRHAPAYAGRNESPRPCERSIGLTTTG